MHDVTLYNTTLSTIVNMHDVALYNTTLSTIVNMHDVALYNTAFSTIVNMHDVALYNTTLTTIVNMHDVALYNTTLSTIVNILLMWPYTTLACQPLSTIVNIHAPEKTRRIPARPQPGWHNEDIRVAKQSRRQAERLYRKTRLTGHHDMFREKCRLVSAHIQETKRHYYLALITDSKNDARKLFGIVNNLLGRRKLRYPPISLLVKLSIGSVDSSTTRSPTFIATSAAATALIRSVTYCHLYQPPWTHYPLCLLMSSSIS